MLSNFQLGNQGLLQSFLVGQPELRTLMQSPQMRQLRQRVTASYHLGPMDQAETQAYVEHRLRHVGWRDHPRFEQGAFDAIFAFAAGIPRQINTLCNRLLLAAYLSEKHAVDTAHVESIVDEIRLELSGPAIPAQDPAASSALSVADEAEIVASASRLEARLARLERAMASVLRFLQPAPRSVVAENSAKRPKGG